MGIDKQVNAIDYIINEISEIVSTYNIEELSALWSFNIKQFDSKIRSKEIQIKTLTTQKNDKLSQQLQEKNNE